ncbi:HTH domain-containing protein, partial [Eubacterium sp.]|uniref:HTH domain-containing protein n=1 Tax=Eubacterium sp. TaxID=142586 RepID=UPI0026DEACD0
MNEKQIRLLQIMMDAEQPLIARSLAEQIGVSIRTIKHYIRTINEQSDERLILSGKSGYWVNKKGVRKFLAVNEIGCRKNQIPQDSGERMWLINQLLLTSGELWIDAYDFCDDYFISFSTLKKDIQKMRSTYQNYNVNYRIIGDRIVLEGSETDIRRLAKYVLFDANKQIIERSVLRQNIPDVDTEQICLIVSEVLEDYKLFADKIAL